MLSSFDQRSVDEARAEYEVEFRKMEIRHRLEIEHQFRMKMTEMEFQQRKLKYLLELRDGLSCQITSIDNLIEAIKGNR